ncbi:MAG: P pilus assembly chaperone PapD [Zhongshania sp.]|jgi:P pilus assembly chaperone PapD
MTPYLQVRRGLLLWFCCVLTGAVNAQIGFSHNWIEFSPRHKTTAVVFTNEGAEPIELEFDSRARNERSVGQQLLIYPPRTRLEPGERQTIRLMVRGINGDAAILPSFFWLDYRYKSLAEIEAPISIPDGASGRISLRTAVSIPVSYVPNGAEPRANTELVLNADGSVRGVLISNNGQAALRINKMQRGDVIAQLKLTILPGEQALVETRGVAPPFRFLAKNHAAIDIQ